MMASYQVLVSDAICKGAGASFFPEWQLLSGVAILASVAIIVFLYLVNKFFQNAEGAGWAKLELYEVFVTVLIMVAVISATNVACNAKASWLFSYANIPAEYDHNIYEASVYYLDSFSGGVMRVTTELYAFYCFMDWLGSMTFTAKPLGLGTSIQPTNGISSTMKAGLTNAFNVMVISYITNKVQIFLIDFISFGFLKYYLPIGIFLRSFTPTRRIGGTIIAIALGFLFVYPFLIILEGAAGLAPLEWMSSTLIPDFQAEFSKFEFMPFIYAITKGVFTLDVFNIIGYILRSGLGILSFGLLYLFASGAGFAFMVGLFFPAFNTLILVTTIRYLSKSMGEEIDVSNLTRLI